MGNEKIRTEHILTSDRSGDGDQIVTTDTGSKTSGNYPKWDGDGNLTGGDTGSGSSWSIAASWEHSISGDTASPIDFTGLSGDDLMILAVNLTASASGERWLRLSVDNGSSYYASSGDYVRLVDSNVVASSVMGRSGQTAGTGVMGFICTILGAGVNGGYKVSVSPSYDSDASGHGNRVFVASTSPINAVRVLNSAGGNFTGGKIFVFSR